ncbi:translation factor GTPase family protein [Streptomyces sp. NPDC049881]|uniref:translation factor GTPase family protein n=1 Tax=Streptomyces sp. NPDC049881 TaxID=3155778 RepID=UPI00342E9D11
MTSPCAPAPTAGTLNIGVLAHVDAGKTSLTERLLFDHGAVPDLGSVDAGSTRTDSGALERERGITIRAAVAAFTAPGGRQINLVDTPGHPDFIAEVERALSVLDGAVLVLSAVEGVQAQTRVLMRTLRRLRLPTLVFVNKIDRMGARYDGLLADVRRTLAPCVVPLTGAADQGTPRARAVALPLGEGAAETLAENDEGLLAALVEGRTPSEARLRTLLARQTAAGLAYPLYCGSALTGEGAAELVAGIGAFLPPSGGDASGEARGTVFAVERSDGGGRATGRKVAYLRLFAGEVRDRQRLTFRRRDPDGTTGGFSGRVTGLDVVAAPGRDAGRRLLAGGIARVRGLADVRVGDRLGEPGDAGGGGSHFAPPGLETAVRSEEADGEGGLWAALSALADEDPLIQVRRAGDGAMSLLLYGAVQREVVEARLLLDFGIDAVFEEPRPVYVERPVGAGEALSEMRRTEGNEFWATVGLRVEPGPYGSGVRYVHDVETGYMPRAFHRAVEETAVQALRQGMHGWAVTDCVLTVHRVGQHSPNTTAADFRKVTPMVVLRALEEAGTRVFEPCQAVELEVPEDTVGDVVGLLAGLGAAVGGSEPRGGTWTVEAELPLGPLQRLVAALPGLTRGEGALWTRPGTDRPVRGVPPRRARTDGNPLDPVEYLRFLADRSLPTGTA